MVRKLHLLTTFVLMSWCCRGADTTKVLYIGNSFIYTFDVPGIVKGFADAANLPLTYSTHAPGGISVGDTAQGTLAHMNNPAVFDLIRQGDWDFVVLQDNQGRFVRDYGVFPASSKVIEGHEKIRDSVRHYNSCARLLWFAGWAFKAGAPPFGNNGVEMIDRIWANYRYLNDSLNEIICPIGPAWKQALTALPAVDPWGPDGAHQSYAGSFLTAATIFTTVFRVHTEQVPYNGTLDSLTSSVYRHIASQTVRDSVASADLEAYAPSLQLNGNIFIAEPGFIAYHWYRNDSLLLSGSNNQYPAAIPGCYHVVAETVAGCLQRSFEHCIYSTGLTEITTGTALSLYPNPARDLLTICTDIPGEKLIRVINSMGIVVRSARVAGLKQELAIGPLPAGVYRVIVEGKEDRQQETFVKAND